MRMRPAPNRHTHQSLVEMFPDPSSHKVPIENLTAILGNNLKRQEVTSEIKENRDSFKAYFKVIFAKTFTNNVRTLE